MPLRAYADRAAELDWLIDSYRVAMVHEAAQFILPSATKGLYDRFFGNDSWSVRLDIRVLRVLRDSGYRAYWRFCLR